MRSPRVMFVHAHPDDESLWTGGTIARVIDRGSATSVVTCTWAAGTTRHAELENALAVLGAGAPTVLGYGDAGFDESAPGRPVLCDCRFDEAVSLIVAEIRSFRPDIVVTYDAYGIYGHPEHIHAHRLTLAAVEAAACAPMYPDAGEPWQIRSMYLSTVPTWLMREIATQIDGARPGTDAVVGGTPDDAIDVTLDVMPWVDRKWSAITEHRSELHRSTALKLLNTLEIDQRNAVLGTEWYLRRDLVVGDVAELP